MRSFSLTLNRGFYVGCLPAKVVDENEKSFISLQDLCDLFIAQAQLSRYVDCARVWKARYEIGSEYGSALSSGCERA